MDRLDLYLYGRSIDSYKKSPFCGRNLHNVTQVAKVFSLDQTFVPKVFFPHAGAIYMYKTIKNQSTFSFDDSDESTGPIITIFPMEPPWTKEQKYIQMVLVH